MTWENNFPLELEGIAHCLLVIVILMRSLMPIWLFIFGRCFHCSLWKLTASSLHPWFSNILNTVY